MLAEQIKDLVRDAVGGDIVPEITRPQPQFGHFATNIAMQLAKVQGANPRQIAEEIAAKLKQINIIDRVEIAGPGFLNIFVTDKTWLEQLDRITSSDNLTGSTKYKNQTIVTEYSDPNPFKELHVGHLYTTIIGDAISNLLAAGGGSVHKVNFGGDVGMHVAKSVWAIIKELGGELPGELMSVKADERPSWLSSRYVEGSAAFEADESAQSEIRQLNKKIYHLVEANDHESPLAQIYWTCRQWSYDYFDSFYVELGSGFERYYPESENAKLGLNTVRSHVGDVYEESDGAVVFRGEKYGLHTRVFVNKEGLPTYETKDIGVALAKKRDYNPDKTVIITGNDIVEYMKVVLKSLKQFEPEIASGTVHITHGQVKISGGVKMSSRLGNVLSAQDVINSVRELVRTQQPNSQVDSTLAAIKYGFLKQGVGADVVFDAKESVSLEGKSGPYLQYAHARANSILAKTGHAVGDKINDLEDAESELLRKITEYEEVLTLAIDELAPHKVATYLYDLTQVFNRFYETNRVVDSNRSGVRIALVRAYQKVLQQGLAILNIEAPEKM